MLERTKFPLETYVFTRLSREMVYEFLLLQMAATGAAAAATTVRETLLFIYTYVYNATFLR